MSSQDCLAAESSTMEDLPGFGICLRLDEQDKSDGPGLGEKCCLYCLLMEESVWVLGFYCFQRLLTKGSSRRTCSNAEDLMAEIGKEDELGPSMLDWSLCH